MVELAWSLVPIVLGALAWDGFRRWLARDREDLRTELEGVRAALPPDVTGELAMVRAEVKDLQNAMALLGGSRR